MRTNDTPKFELVNFISPAVRASMDKMCFMTVYATKTLYEVRVPRSQREYVEKALIDLHSRDDALQQFQAAWIEWLDEHQAELSDMEEDSDDEEDAAAKAPAGFRGAWGSDTEKTPPPAEGPASMAGGAEATAKQGP